MAVDHNNPQSRDEEILIATIDGNEYDKLPQSRMEELLLELKEVIEEGGGGGTSDYENLSNQPQVNGETLIGDKTGAELGLVDAEEGKGLSTNDYNDAEKAAVAAATSAISAIKDGVDIDSFGDVEVALLDKADISDLGTAAAKDSTNAVTSGSTNLVESGAVKDAIDAAVAAAYHHAGTKTVAQLTHDLLVAANEGNVYNITDSGTTTSDFIEGIGKTIDEGSNVGICKVGNVYMFDLLSGFVDTSNFVQKSATAGLIKNDGTIDTVEKQPITDNNLNTTDKTTTGAINEVNSGLTTLDTEVNGDATVYNYADVITIPDAVPANLVDCSVKVEPVQDLHGYDKPWVGGAWKNKVHAKNYTSDSYDGTTFNNVGADQWIADDVTLPAGTYTYSLKLLSLPSADRSFSVYKSGDPGTIYFNVDHLQNATVGQVYSDTFTLAEETTIVTRLWGSGGGEFKIQMQLEAGSQPTEYESYENICPITGHTESVVTRNEKNYVGFGKNTTDKTAQYRPTANQRLGFDVLGDNKIKCKTMYDSNVWNSGYIEVLVPPYVDISKFKLSYTVTEKSSGIASYNPGAQIDLAKSSVGHIMINIWMNDSEPVSNGQYFILDNVQLEYGDTVTPFEPYKGQTYTILFKDAQGQTITVYGAWLNTKSGVMTVDRAYAKITSLTRNDDHQFYCIVSPTPGTNLSTVDKLICDKIATGNAANVDNICTNSVRAVLVNTEQAFSTASDAMTYFGGSIDICYMVNSPITIHLTPQQIQLLKGTNTLYASTGDISVTVNGVSGAIGAVQSELSNLASAIAEKLPDAPTTDGDYTLKVSVSSGIPTYSWVADTP